MQIAEHGCPQETLQRPVLTVLYLFLFRGMVIVSTVSNQYQDIVCPYRTLPIYIIDFSNSFVGTMGSICQQGQHSFDTDSIYIRIHICDPYTSSQLQHRTIMDADLLMFIHLFWNRTVIQLTYLPFLWWFIIMKSTWQSASGRWRVTLAIYCVHVWRAWKALPARIVY